MPEPREERPKNCTTLPGGFGLSAVVRVDAKRRHRQTSPYAVPTRRTPLVGTSRRLAVVAEGYAPVEPVLLASGRHTSLREKSTATELAACGARGRGPSPVGRYFAPTRGRRVHPRPKGRESRTPRTFPCITACPRDRGKGTSWPSRTPGKPTPDGWARAMPPLRQYFLRLQRSVKDLVAGSGIEFEDRGEHELKGISEPWHVFSVAG